MAHTKNIFLALALGLGAAASAVASSVAEVQLAVTPSFLTLDAKEHSSGDFEVQVENQGDEAFSISAQVLPLEGVQDERLAVEWITVEPSDLSVEPGEARSITVHIEVPEGVQSGGRYAAIALTTGSAPAGDNAPAISGRVLVPVWMAVTGSGELIREPVVERFAPVVEGDGRIGFRAQVRNNGNVHASVQGSVVVGTNTAAALASLDFPRRAIRPGETEILRTQGTLPLPGDMKYGATSTFIPPEEFADQEHFQPQEEQLEFELAPVELEVSALDVCENLDRGPSITGELLNQSDLGVLPAVQFDVANAEGTVLGSASPQLEPVAWPGEQTEISADFSSRLETGEYTVVTTVAYGAGEVLERETTFQVGGDPATAIPLCDDPFLGDGGAATPGAGA